MNDEPRSEFGQPQESAVPSGPGSLPEPAPARGPRRPSRRRLLVASMMLIGVSLVVGGGVLLVSRQPPGGTTSPAGSADAGSKDFGRVPRGDDLVARYDASVFLQTTVDGAQQEAIRGRVAALPVVEQFAFESQAEAYENYVAQYRNQPRMLRGVTPRILPSSFRVVLHDPSQFSELFREFCPQLGPDGKPACAEGVDPSQQEAIRRDLEALPAVERVDFESEGAALVRLQQSGVQDPQVLDSLALDSFRVRLRDPRQFPALYGRLCSGRWSFSTKPICKPGVRVVIANPRSVYYGLER